MTPAPADDFEKDLASPERLPDAINTDTLRKYFTLTQPDLNQTHQCRGVVNKLGFAAAYLVLADIILGPHPSRPRCLTQPVTSLPIRFSTSRLPQLACICTH